MKRISLAVAVASLLATPVVLAQAAEPSVSPPAATANDWFKDVGTYQLLLRGTPSPLTGSFEDAARAGPKPDAATAVTGSFEDATIPDAHPAPASAVTGSFVGLYSGD
jgi:opacity protein-like surface antigen